MRDQKDEKEPVPEKLRPNATQSERMDWIVRRLAENLKRNLREEEERDDEE